MGLRWGASASLAGLLLACSGGEAGAGGSRGGISGTGGGQFGNPTGGSPGGDDFGGGPMGGAAAGGGTGGAGVGNGGGSVFDEPNCGAVQITPKVDFSPGNILVLFDRSGSMEDVDFNLMRRFDAANNALIAAVEPYVCDGVVRPDGTPCTDPLTLGTVLFPSGATLLCDPVVPFENQPQITWRKSTEWLPVWRSFADNPNFGLGTPIEYAFMEADRVLYQYRDQLEGAIGVLFLTDGGSTCAPGAPTVDGMGTIPFAPDLAMKWAADGIRTHVVSVEPGGSAFNDQIASAGGTGSSINPANPAELEAAMRSIIQETATVASCDIALEGGKLADFEGACAMGTVLVGPQKLDCDPQNGFSVTGPSEISLHGSACDALMAGGFLTATFPCEVIEPQ